MKRVVRTKRNTWNNTYGFSQYLDRPGDFVETSPMPLKEASNLIVAAHMWAWDNSCRVSVSSYRVGVDRRVVRVTLTDNKRERDYR